MASFTFEIGKCSVCGAMLWRAQNSSMSCDVTGAPLGEPEMLFWPMMIDLGERRAGMLPYLALAVGAAVTLFGHFYFQLPPS